MKIKIPIYEIEIHGESIKVAEAGPLMKKIIDLQEQINQLKNEKD